jgi:hypothetical protein
MSIQLIAMLGPVVMYERLRTAPDDRATRPRTRVTHPDRPQQPRQTIWV